MLRFKLCSMVKKGNDIIIEGEDKRGGEGMTRRWGKIFLKSLIMVTCINRLCKILSRIVWDGAFESLHNVPKLLLYWLCLVGFIFPASMLD